MNAVAATEPRTRAPQNRTAQTGPRLSPELEEVILEIAASERALDDVLVRASRLHESSIRHDPRSCLVCFSEG